MNQAVPPWMQKPSPADEIAANLKQVEQESRSWQAPDQQRQMPQGPPPGWQQLPNGQWVAPGQWHGYPAMGQPVQQMPVQQQQFYPQGPAQAPQMQQYPPRQPVQQGPPPGWRQGPDGRWWPPQPVPQAPPQVPVQQKLPPAGLPPKPGMVPVSKKQKRVINVALSIAVLSLLLALASAAYFVIKY